LARLCLSAIAHGATITFPEATNEWMVMMLCRRIAMNRILLTGTTLLTLISAGMPASAAHKHATPLRQAPLQRQWLGSGALIDAVDRNSPAERAGLRAGDVIVGINGSRINGQSDVTPFLGGGGGRPLTIDVKRGATLVRLRAAPRNGLLGYTYTYYPFCPGGRYCASDDPPPEPYIPPPPIPDIPQPSLQPPIQQN
jgi:membrane-associated protease RseP (regulator of RpoE activity)